LAQVDIHGGTFPEPNPLQINFQASHAGHFLGRACGSIPARLCKRPG
jgi:hypothetical protein